MRGELWILGQVGQVGLVRLVGQVRQVGQVEWGENFEFWIGHKLQACTSGGENALNNLRDKFKKKECLH